MEPSGNPAGAVFGWHMDFLSYGRTGIYYVRGGLSCPGNGGNADFPVGQKESAEVTLEAEFSGKYTAAVLQGRLLEGNSYHGAVITEQLS